MKLDPSIPDIPIPELPNHVELEKMHGQSYKHKEDCRNQTLASKPALS